MADKIKTGKIGEEEAVIFLKNNNYIIKERNFKFGKKGEIDIIAEEGDYIVFIEVKARKSKIFGVPQDGVNFFKQKKLIQLSNYYLKQKGLYNRNCRFDVVAIKLNESEKVEKIELIKNAF